MQVQKYNHLTKEQSQKFTDILFECFEKNEFFFEYLVGRNSKTLRRLMRMNVEFHNHNADFYALVDDNGKWVAAAIYLPVGHEAIGIASALRRRKILNFIEFFTSQPFKYCKRFIDFSTLESASWYSEPFVTLDVAVSVEKGCGKMLIEQTIDNYIGQNIALNSSVSLNDHSYYKQFGFETYKELVLDNYKTVMMIKKA